MFIRYLVLLTLLVSSGAFAQPTVWKAEKDDRIYTLMGTIHLGKPDYYPLPVAITSAFDETDGLVVEANILSDTNVSLPKGNPAKNYLNSNELDLLSSIAKKAGLPATALMNMTPWQAAFALQQYQAQQLGMKTELGIDVHFLSKALKLGVPIISLETVQQQLDMVANMRNDGLPLLLDTINEWDNSEKFLSCLESAWLAGDSATMTKLLNESMEDAEETEHVLLTDRNKKWVDTLRNPYKFKRGNYTVVVGALHMYGDQGLITLLKEKGFQVTVLNKEGRVGCFDKL
ncbi:TraB/GumN family protein [Enterovibrio sp. ZSDZ35]|uniref:TraB/GumN family protein n=1 Tax=Enterovibrio qingdaonensis TaxID=2899818 RepID=A0ABT5QKG3_9GAMM|nr:TraB/GumN family protein [Enterovibrio sp. ZSDZ35]MDD1781472.1 TraB/GumN family protein [Enterovibrio sp. ZSDZ35]